MIVLGVVLLCLSLSLCIYNFSQNYYASQKSNDVVMQLEERIDNTSQVQEPAKATNAIIDGNQYMGYLSFPSLNLKLPVMEHWDYAKLKVSPCHYYGSVERGNFVVMAHNYASHFGKISKLNMDDKVFFTDLNGNVTEYQVVARDVLNPYSAKEVKNSGYPLTLFTCTYGGQSRVVVYCSEL